MFASTIRKKRVQAMRQHTHWQWHLDEVSFHNHFNQERHLVSRDIYKARRSAALTEWQALAN